jgi:hypothetical protein
MKRIQQQAFSQYLPMWMRIFEAVYDVLDAHGWKSDISGRKYNLTIIAVPVGGRRGNWVREEVGVVTLDEAVALTLKMSRME